MSQGMSRKEVFENVKLSRAMAAEFSAFAEFSAGGRDIKVGNGGSGFKPANALIASFSPHSAGLGRRSQVALKS